MAGGSRALTMTALVHPPWIYSALSNCQKTENNWIDQIQFLSYSTHIVFDTETTTLDLGSFHEPVLLTFSCHRARPGENTEEKNQQE